MIQAFLQVLLERFLIFFLFNSLGILSISVKKASFIGMYISQIIGLYVLIEYFRMDTYFL
jgi:hypothetical protein